VSGTLAQVLAPARCSAKVYGLYYGNWKKLLKDKYPQHI